MSKINIHQKQAEELRKLEKQLKKGREIIKMCDKFNKECKQTNQNVQNLPTLNI